MDRYFPSTSPEYIAHKHIADYVFWDANIGAEQIGLCAAYASLQRYVKGEDLYIPPRDVAELQAILRMYSDHVVGSLCSQVVSRVSLRATDGYAKARAVSARSLQAALNNEENLTRLVELHTPPEAETIMPIVPILERAASHTSSLTRVDSSQSITPRRRIWSN